MKKRKPSKREVKKFTEGGIVPPGGLPVILGGCSLVVKSDPPTELIGTGLIHNQIPPHLYPVFVGVYMEG